MKRTLNGRTEVRCLFGVQAGHAGTVPTRGPSEREERSLSTVLEMQTATFREIILIR